MQCALREPVERIEDDRREVALQEVVQQLDE
jgi:hypothetical protein